MESAQKKLKGIVHVHSKRSFDGAFGYGELRKLFIGSGLDFACMTEHIEHLTQADIEVIIQDCHDHSDNQFLLIPGIETDCFAVYFLGISRALIDFSSNRAIYNSLRPNAKLCVLSHPIKARFRYPHWIIEDCDAVEIMNNKHDGKFYFRPQSEKLWKTIRQSRPEVVPVVGMDFHQPAHFCPVYIQLTQQGPLTADFVLEQLRMGRTQFFDGNRCLSTADWLSRNYFRGRIYAMDWAHSVNKALHRFGIRVPRGLRKRFARVMEGR